MSHSPSAPSSAAAGTPGPAAGMPNPEPQALHARVTALLASPAITERRPPAEEPWPLPGPEPLDLAALYAVTDGLVLADGATLLRRGELARATDWLKQDRSLDWPEGLVVLGEHQELVVVLDLDPTGARAGGGILEAPHDGLSTFQRLDRSALGYLERHAGVGPGDPGPEQRLADAIARRDVAALHEALALPLYPGAERNAALGALTLGSLLAAAGDDAGALKAFERSVAARVRAARRGAGALERAAALRACVAAAREAGATTLAEQLAQQR
ncbi:hypothetical protein [Chondromyces crocatus]|uniref:Uncharacterized protein n=1 Tax=Chondromyces crocatus TaxID=52 RepID=A0A0K1EER0_CHOCO|nr:hypothetical protein [Chondromyces crocatus]AKT39360.1 uncharacterized protein CMC5_035070 [Chondromyces crocatus]